jgi:hypothetical protein
VGGTPAYWAGGHQTVFASCGRNPARPGSLDRAHSTGPHTLR